jgi:hypothetical protein
MIGNLKGKSAATEGRSGIMNHERQINSVMMVGQGDPEE